MWWMSSGAVSYTHLDVYKRQVPDTARLGDAEIDWGKGIVRRNGGETALTAKEFALLKKLWDAQSNIVTIDALCDTLWLSLIHI